jgi:pimeloyl-ACP methyl ester carboxylesterase
MTINIKNIDINYIQYGKGKKNIVLLHGWGQNIEMMNPLGTKLENSATITVIDLPGHGGSSEPKEAITIYDYCDIVKTLLDKLKIVKPILIGHSFGGRVAIVFASQYDTEKLILLGAPCIRKKSKPSFKVKLLKSLKKVPGLNKLEGIAKKHIGSRDYRNASEVMRQILVNTVNEDLSECAKKIECPTLLIWGSNDSEAPLEEAQELETIMKDAGLVVYDGGSHYTYLEFLNPVCNVIRTFIKE